MTKEEFQAAVEVIEHAMVLKPGSSIFQVLMAAYRSGVRAKDMGWPVCPYYEDEIRTPYWEAGYAGLDLILPDPKRFASVEMPAKVLENA
jgi:hypothetical protein